MKKRLIWYASEYFIGTCVLTWYLKSSNISRTFAFDGGCLCWARKVYDLVARQLDWLFTWALSLVICLHNWITWEIHVASFHRLKRHFNNIFGLSRASNVQRHAWHSMRRWRQSTCMHNWSDRFSVLLPMTQSHCGLAMRSVTRSLRNVTCIYARMKK